MKRTFIIILGVVILIILLVLWFYVLFFIDPKETNDKFADFDITGEELNGSIDGNAVGDTNTATIFVSPDKKLQQLTTKPVIGFQEIASKATSSPGIVYYIEAGVGHVYKIDLTTGTESQISKKTIANARVGAINSTGEYALIQSGYGSNQKTLLFPLSSSDQEVEPKAIELEPNITEITATENGTFLYAVKGTDRLVAKEYYPISGNTDTLFVTPFREADVDFSSKSTDKHLIYPKASALLDGYLYQSVAGGVKRLPVTGQGLTAIGYDRYVLYSKQSNGAYRSYITNTITGSSTDLNISLLPEKCTRVNKSGATNVSLVCAFSLDNQLGGDFPDQWYRGEIKFTDDLWEINPALGAVTQLLDITAESGRKLDAVSLKANQFYSRVYFTNKNDKTLWLYRI